MVVTRSRTTRTSIEHRASSSGEEAPPHVPSKIIQQEGKGHSSPVRKRRRSAAAEPATPPASPKKKSQNAAKFVALPLPPPPTSAITIPPRSTTHFGLIQERLALLPSPTYALCIQAILWNQTTGRTALPVLQTLLSLFPTPLELSAAPLPLLTSIVQPIGLHNIRAARLLAFANAWVASPPCKDRRYVRRDYPIKGAGRDARLGEVLTPDDPREGWEIANLPGMGPYAIDSWRIFGRDKLRGIESGDYDEETGYGNPVILDDTPEPEWTRVIPEDKDLRKWMAQRWRVEGHDYDILTGERKSLSEAMADVSSQD